MNLSTANQLLRWLWLVVKDIGNCGEQNLGGGVTRNRQNRGELKRLFTALIDSFSNAFRRQGWHGDDRHCTSFRSAPTLGGGVAGNGNGMRVGFAGSVWPGSFYDKYDMEMIGVARYFDRYQPWLMEWPEMETESGLGLRVWVDPVLFLVNYLISKL